MITFVTARGPNKTGVDSFSPVIEGWYWAHPPRFTRRLWEASWDEEAEPADWGYVSLRHSRKAIVGFFDGHTGTLGEGQIQDMRRWSNDADRFEWQLTPY